MTYLKEIFTTVKKQSPILYWIAMIHFLLIIVCMIGLFIDERTLQGVNVWVKPLKFSISLCIYTLTVGYIITLYPFSKRKKNIINNIVSWTLLLEMGIIIYQAQRGVQSHYNTSSTLDSLLFLGMGVLTILNVLVMFLFIIETIRLKLKTTTSTQVAILIGWLIIVAGSWVGGQMINQLSHNVGAADGGAGLPLLNWSTVVGDLRVAHFFGLHGIQIIPLFALWVSNRWEIKSTNQVIIITVFGLIYALWIGFVFYQAKQGIPLISV